MIKTIKNLLFGKPAEIEEEKYNYKKSYDIKIKCHNRSQIDEFNKICAIYKGIRGGVQRYYKSNTGEFAEGFIVMFDFDEWLELVKDKSFDWSCKVPIDNFWKEFNKSKTEDGK
jgi:hypothetical protein